MNLTGNIEPFHLSRMHGQEAFMPGSMSFRVKRTARFIAATASAELAERVSMLRPAHVHHPQGWRSLCL